MGRFRNFVLLFFLFIFIYALCLAEYKSSAKRHSILGNGKGRVYGQLDKYNIFLDIESIILPNAAISQGYIPPSFEETLPEFVQEIADGNFENIVYSAEKLQKNDLVSADTVESIPPVQDILTGIVAELPFGSRLSISGKKLIGLNYTTNVYDKEESGKRENTSFLKMEQELQIKIFGSIKDRLNINVDYDDTVGKKDISFVYKGQPGEFVQEAAFGDISVSFANTEFTEYSKELFGLKVDMRYKTLGLNTFFSKTKGLSEIKRFTGNTQLERRIIADTSYIKLKYYSLLRNAEMRTIENGSVEVYIDHRKLDPAYNISITADAVLRDLNRTGISYKGNFVRLVAGRDYTVDYNTGTLVFKNTLASSCVVAVNYKFTDGSALGDSPLIIKDMNNTVTVTTELKTFYDLGNLDIIRDNARGNFLLEIKDLNGNTPSAIERGKDVPAYPPKTGYGANITVDFENGIFNLAQILHDDLYLKGTSKYRFITEYQYAIKTLALRPGIVPKSEKIVVDGMTLKSESDYVIDYDTGILTVKNENIIKETSVLDVSYDYSTIFGSQGESTLIGASSRLSLTDNISLGASILYNFTAKGTVIPNIRNVPTSLSVGGGDIKITDLGIDALNMKINAEAEYALSVQNVNTSNKAIIDSMDGSICEDLASMLDESWFHSADRYCTPRNLDDLSWKSYEIYLRDIDPSLELVDEQKQLVLELNYDVRYRSRIAFAQKLSLEGYDFSKKLYIDVWIQDNNLSSPEFIVDYASYINEDADGNGILDTEDTDGNGILSPWEDTGQKFHNIDGTVSLIGAHNGKLDTEDLNGNGILDTLEAVAGSYSISSGTVIKTNANGWRQIRIPLNIASDNRAKWKNIRILRFNVQKISGEQGKIVIGKIAISGSKWERTGMNLENFNISTIGKFDPEYKSLLSNKYYLDLYGIKDTVRKDEQALKITYNATSSRETFLAKSVYAGDPLNISKYKSIKFMVYAKPESGYAAIGDVIIFRAGGNDSNYFEYRIPVTADSSWQDWKLIAIDQNGIGRFASWSSLDPSAEIIVYGNPSLDRISQFVIGVESSQSGMNHQIWFNEIHVVENKAPDDGAASKVSGSLQWNGTGIIGAVSVGASRKSIDRNFQTIAAGVYNRDYSEDSAYFSFDGLKINTTKVLPVKTGISRIETVTPKITENKSNLISLNDKGRIVTYTGYAETNLKFSDNFPQFTARYSRSIIDSSEVKRLEDKEIFSGTVVYDNPLEFVLLPINVTADARVANSYYKVYPSVPVARSNSFLGLDSMKEYLDIKQYHTLEQSNMFAVKLPFKFSHGITFSPSYIINVVKEKNNDFTQEIEYDKTLNQTIGASFVLGLASWFNPAFTYNINTKENYCINADDGASSLFIPGQKKYIERKVIGEISWNLNAFDVTSSPFFKSLSFSTYYRLQDSDSYDNVDKGFRSTDLTMGKLWVRNSPLMDLPSFYLSDSYIVKTILNTDDVRLSGKYMPFEAFSFTGFLSPLNTVSVNCTYVGNSESSYITGTKKNIYTRVCPEILIGMSGVERFFGAVKWMLDTQFNFKYHNKTITTYGISYVDSIMLGLNYRFKFLKMFNLYFAFENTNFAESDYVTSKNLSDTLSKKYVGQCSFDLGEWRFSLKYENERHWQKNALGKYASNICKNIYLGQIKSDIIFPFGIKVPVINKVLPFKNRIIFLSDFRYVNQKSEANVEKDNNINFGISVNADYEISKYCRFLIGVNLDRFKYRYNADLDYYNISLIGKLTLQF